MPGISRFSKKPETSATTAAAAAATMEPHATVDSTAAATNASSSIECKTPKRVTFGGTQTKHLAAEESPSLFFTNSPFGSSPGTSGFSPCNGGDEFGGVFGGDEFGGVFGGDFGDGDDAANEFASDYGSPFPAAAAAAAAGGGGGGGISRFRGRPLQQQQQTTTTSSTATSLESTTTFAPTFGKAPPPLAQQQQPSMQDSSTLAPPQYQGIDSIQEQQQQQQQENQAAAGAFQPGGDYAAHPSFFTKQDEQQQLQQPKHGDTVLMQPATSGGLPGHASSFHNHQQKMPATGTKTVASAKNSSHANKNMQPATKAPTHPGPKNTAGLLLGVVQNSIPTMQQQPLMAVQAATRPGPDAAVPITRNDAGAMQQHQHQHQQSKNHPFPQGQNGMPTKTTLKIPQAIMQQRTNAPPPPAATTTTTTKMHQPKDAPTAAVHGHQGETNGVSTSHYSHSQMQQRRTNDPSASSASNNSLASAPTNAPSHSGGGVGPSQNAFYPKTATTSNSQGQQQQHPTITPARPGGSKALPIAAQNSLAGLVHLQEAQQRPAAAANAFSVTPDTRVARAFNSTTTEQRGGLPENSSIQGNRGTATGNVITPKNAAGTANAAFTLDAVGAAAADDVSFDDLKNELLNELRDFDDVHETYQEGMLNDHVALGAWHAELLIMLAEEMDLCAKIDEAIALADEIIHNNGLEDAAATTAAAAPAPATE